MRVAEVHHEDFRTALRHNKDPRYVEAHEWAVDYPRGWPATIQEMVKDGHPHQTVALAILLELRMNGS